MENTKNNYTNFILTLIAVVLMGILFKGSIITKAEAVAGLSSGNYRWLKAIHEDTRNIILDSINSKCGN